MLIAAIWERTPSVSPLGLNLAGNQVANMAGLLDILRGGDWLTLARMRLWALAVLVAAAGGLLYLVASSDGLMDYQDRPLGTDFSNVYAAGTYVLEGKPAPIALDDLATTTRATFRIRDSLRTGQAVVV